MTDDVLTPKDLVALGRFDTPTICNAIEVLAPARRATGFTTEPLVCADPALPPIVGFARTATIRAMHPPPGGAAGQRQRRAEYYTYVGRAPGPTITVIQDLDPRPGFGAFWGEVNSAVHKALGCLGAITNGSFRDVTDLAPGFQILGGEIGPSHGHVHVVDFASQVNVFGMTVEDGDLVHADRHGAVVVPAEIARDLPGAVDLIARREKVILDVCKSPDFDVEKLKQAMATAAEIH